jgi:gluconokinase
MDYLIGIDLGTTNFKVLVVDILGNSVFKASVPIETWHPQQGFAEQKPHFLLNNCLDLLKKAVKAIDKKPLFVSFSAAMHSLIAVDKNGDLLTDAMIWADNRAEKQADNLKNRKLGQSLFQATGTPIHPLSPMLKLVWLRENQPQIFEKAAWFCSIKAFIFYKLFGVKIEDLSIASASGLMETDTLNWHKSALKFAKIGEIKLPKIVSPYHFETLKSNALIPELIGVQFVIGASDGVLSSLAAGAVGDNLTTITIGTSGAVRRITKKRPLSIKPKNEQNLSKLFTYCLDNEHFVKGGATNNGGIALDWLSKNIFKTETNDLLKAAENVPIGSDGLVFLPYILGERALIWDAHIRGAFLNVSFEHTQAHFVRATLEGILFNLHQIHAAIEAELSPSTAIFADGGFTHSKFSAQLIADIFNKPVRTRVGEDGGCLGAIMMGMKAIGLCENLSETTTILKQTTEVFFPSENAVAYRLLYEKYATIVAKFAQK